MYTRHLQHRNQMHQCKQDYHLCHDIRRVPDLGIFAFTGNTIDIFIHPKMNLIVFFVLKEDFQPFHLCVYGDVIHPIKAFLVTVPPPHSMLDTELVLICEIKCQDRRGDPKRHGCYKCPF